MRLMHGDCLELMRDIPDKSVDMVLCDLPYGTTENKWDKPVPFEPLWVQYKRICKPNAAICLFSQMPFTARIIASNPGMFRYEWIWRKSQGTGFLNANRMPLKAHENILIFYERLPKYDPQKTYGAKPYHTTRSKMSANYGEMRGISETHCTDGSRYPVDVLEFPTVNNSKESKLHPTQKPVPLLEYLIKTYTNEDETVLDNCMGSGSTGVACMNTGRDFIGIELDKSYFDIAQKRITENIIRI